LSLIFIGAIANSNRFLENIWPMAVTSISCTGNEEALLRCSFSTEPISACNQRSDASVFCQSESLILDLKANEFLMLSTFTMSGTLTIPSNCTSGEVRLSGDLTSESGRLEVCNNNAWGTVCNNHWDIRDALVACRALGFQQFYGKLLIC
jgi:hypothetical protein